MATRDTAPDAVEETYGLFTEGELGNTLFGLTQGPIYLTETELVLGYDRPASFTTALKEQLASLGSGGASDRSVSLAEVRERDRSLRVPRDAITDVQPRNLTSGLSYVTVEASDRPDPVTIAVGATVADAGKGREAKRLAERLQSWAST